MASEDSSVRSENVSSGQTLSSSAVSIASENAGHNYESFYQDSPHQSLASPYVISRHGTNGQANLTSSRHSRTHQGTPASGKTSTPRSAARSQTLLINSKMRHIKKRDGEPLWRKDIQYDFLYAIFHDNTRVFTNAYDGTTNHTYSEIYIDAMARSSKSSRVLREKLLGDHQAGLNIAMVCLLVNIGRMNTTLNFFPEMRAQLRTYHPIPSLQSYADPTAYKQLQDAPRLKSILKGACEDQPEPSTLEQLLIQTKFPRTNPINLVFILATYARRVSEIFFVEPHEFYDLIMNTELSSESRALAFLWLMWAYLESDLSPAQLRTNPFGIGQEDGTKVPAFDLLSPEQVDDENVDTISEKEFAERMIEERKRNIESNWSAVIKRELPSNLQRRKRKLKRKSGVEGLGEDGSDSEGSPHSQAEMGGFASPYSASFPEPKSSSRSSSKRQKKSEVAAYELMVEREKKCNFKIDHLIRISDRRQRRNRVAEGAIHRAWKSIKTRDPFEHSEDEQSILNAELIASAASSHKRRNVDMSALNSQIQASLADGRDPNAVQDFGEECEKMATAFRRANRWISRWYGIKNLDSRPIQEFQQRLVMENPLKKRTSRQSYLGRHHSSKKLPSGEAEVKTEEEFLDEKASTPLKTPTGRRRKNTTTRAGPEYMQVHSKSRSGAIHINEEERGAIEEGEEDSHSGISMPVVAEA
ncbi:uncharacterized protein V1516DRAFT_655744 [Lipomyces oligophaga]|uniref:uncharacterized protein n=1 Tax=Lipomyces oligophaga TaxID=45792 RepID=UPI0034CEAFBA